jgi:membrane-bound metal-dependent hydrolase YbcI (DUF457 family)
MLGSKIINLFLLVLASFCFLLCLILASRQVNPFRPPSTHRERIRQAVTVGLLTGGGFLCLLLIIDLVTDSGFQWTIESLATVLVCLILPLQLLAMVGTYIEFAWQERIRRHLVRLSEKSKERDKN